MHAHHYVDNEDLRGKNVVVLGMGNSAMDIAVEASHVASNVYLAMRRSEYIIPKYLWGRPLDQLGLSPKIPFAIRRLILSGIIRSTTGELTRYGLPRPDHKIGQAHPTISDHVLPKLTHGDITPKPNIDRLEGDSVRFADGSVEQADVVIYCTGYKVTFPFFDEGFIAAPRNDLPLYRRVFHPEIPNVFFIALLQPLGATMPLAEAQGEWVGEYLRGEYALPSKRALRRDMERERRRMFRQYTASPRHTMQVDFDRYLLDLGRERRRGRERARDARLRVAGRAARGSDAVRARRGLMAATAGRRELTKERNRAAILDAARAAFAAEGYGGTAVRDIVRRTDLSPGTFYNYFPDKESIFLALVEESTSRIRARLREARREARTLDEFVAGAYRAWFGAIAADPAMFELLRRNAGTVRAMLDDALLAAGLDDLLQDLDAAIARGELPADRRALHGARDGRRRARGGDGDARASPRGRRRSRALRRRVVPRRHRAHVAGVEPQLRAHCEKSKFCDFAHGNPHKTSTYPKSSVMNKEGSLWQHPRNANDLVARRGDAAKPMTTVATKRTTRARKSPRESRKL